MKATILLLTMLFSSMSYGGEAYGTYDDSPTKPFDASEVKYSEMSITWKRVDKKDLLKECQKRAAKIGVTMSNDPVNGCTFWSDDTCLVITAKMTTMHTLGHEMRHCYQRAWH